MIDRLAKIERGYPPTTANSASAPSMATKISKICYKK